MIEFTFCSIELIDAEGGEKTVVRLNKGGLIACALYTAHFCFFFGWALFAGIRGSGFLIGAAVFPAGFSLSGLTALFGGSEFPFSIDSWLNTTPAYYIESLAIVYLAGWAVSALTMTSVMPDDTPAAKPESDRARKLVLAACLLISAPCDAAQRTLDWADELCRYKLMFDPSKYDADRLKNTVDFVVGRTFMRFPLPKYYRDPPEGELAAYKEACSNYAAKLSSFPMIDLPGLQDYRNMLLLELQDWCDFWQVHMRGSQGDTSALRSFAPSAGHCSIYIDALEGKVDVNDIWRKTVISSCTRNYKPKACEAEHFAANGKPDAAQLIRSDVLEIGWQNCSAAYLRTTGTFRKKADSLERVLQGRITARFRMVRSQCSY